MFASLQHYFHPTHFHPGWDNGLDQDEDEHCGLVILIIITKNIKTWIWTLGGPNPNQKNNHHNHSGGFEDVTITVFC
jgi:hypothetical protein